MSHARSATALPFLVDIAARLPPGDALDVACGSGRHLELLVGAGHRVSGVDRSLDALERARWRAPGATLVTHDVEASGLPFEDAAFDLVVMTFFLWRPLFPELRRVLRPGGRLVVETFHDENRRRSGHPRRPEFALAPGELSRLLAVAGLGIEHVDEGDHDGLWTSRALGRR